MKRPPWTLFAALLPLCAATWAQDPPPPAAKSFDPKSANVREILRTAALKRASVEPATSPAETAPPDDLAARIARTLALKFNDRRIDHMECDALQCYAYTRAGEVLFTTPRDPNTGSWSDVPKGDAALSCLDTNDLLSTFDRIDRCRGIGVGVPLQWSDGAFSAPAPGRDRPRDSR